MGERLDLQTYFNNGNKITALNNQTKQTTLSLALRDQNDLRYTQVGRWGISIGSAAYAALYPLPGELGEVGKRDVLLKLGTITNHAFYTAPNCRLTAYIAPPLQKLGVKCTFSRVVNSTAYTSPLVTQGTAFAFAVPQTQYLRIQATLTLPSKQQLGYTTISRNPWYYIYDNYIWCGITVPRTKPRGCIMIPVSITIPSEWRNITQSVVYTKPDYKWEDGLPCPNATGGEIFY